MNTDLLKKRLLSNLALGALLLSGCNSTSYERGENLALGAGLVFSAPQDEKKFRKIKAEIQKHIENGKPITQLVIERYVADKVLPRFGGNPAAMRILIRKLDAALDLGEFDLTEVEKLEALDEFARGVVGALELLYPDFYMPVDDPSEVSEGGPVSPRG